MTAAKIKHATATVNVYQQEVERLQQVVERRAAKLEDAKRKFAQAKGRAGS